MLKTRLLSLFLAALAVSAVAAPPAAYHLELEAYPAAAFPYLSKFGTVELHVYSRGVRAEVLWLNAISRNGAPAVTVLNPLARMYVDVSVAEIAPILKSMAGNAAKSEQVATPLRIVSSEGKVKGIQATRHRIVYGETAFLDYWTTTTLPENPQLKAISQQILSALSPATATATKGIRGVPVYVEANFRRFKKVRLLTVKKLTLTADDEEDALERGALYVRASVLEKIWEK